MAQGYYPWVILLFLKTSEWLAPRQVTDDIKCNAVVPCHHIYRASAPFAALAQSLEEQVDVGGDERLLIHHGLHGEAVREDSAHPTVVLKICTEEVMFIAENGQWLLHVLGLASAAMAIPVFPCFGKDERELVVGDSDNGPVFVVQVQDLFVRLSADLGESVGDAACSPCFGAREISQRMEEDVIKGFP